jgi:hypothetical protein
MKNKKLSFLCIVLLLFSSLSAEDKRYVTGSILGGLGNQMFEVATTCALAWDNGAEPYFPDFIPLLPHSKSLHHVFFRCALNPPKDEVSCDWATPAYGYEAIPFTNGMRLSGYSQNEMYFARYRERLIRLFAPKADDLQYIRRKYKKILQHPYSVCVHVRYYFAEKPDEPAFRQYDEEYYEKAMDLFTDDALFVVISDNMDFAKKIIPTKGKNVVFIENEPHYIDFFLQTLCKHNIIANSTFSWWGAWLNQNPEKVVVRPSEWIGGNPDIGGPDTWIKIRAKSYQERMG